MTFQDANDEDYTLLPSDPVRLEICLPAVIELPAQGASDLL